MKTYKVGERHLSGSVLWLVALYPYIDWTADRGKAPAVRLDIARRRVTALKRMYKSVADFYFYEEA